MIHTLLSSLIHANSVTLRKLGAHHNIVTSLLNVNEATAHALGARGNLVSSSHDTYDEEASGELGQRYSSTYSSSSTQTNAATPRKLQTHLSGITSWPTQINAATSRKLQTRLSGGTRSPTKINAATLRKRQTRVSGESLPSKVAVSEENIYLLCKKLCDDGLADPDGSDLFIIFISNEKKQIPLWHQKASQRAEGVILWDYHVICLQNKRDEKSSSLVWDLDSSLPFPSPLGTYVAESIRPSIQIFSEFKRFFRVVHAPIFLRHFASDRRHMKDSAGNWIAKPPSHEAIVAKDGAVHNLNEYITVSPDDVVIDVGADTVNVVFSDKLGVVIPLWHQKASQRAEGVILWDYHVICLQNKRDEKSSSLVWDLDSSLLFPSPLGTYVAESIRPSIQIFSEFKRFFRVVHAPIFLRHFASDRRHMKDSAGNWIAKPPSHEAIVAKDGAVHNLNEYITVSPDDVVIDVGADTVNVVFSDKLGVVVSENDLLGFFSLIS
ncbi:Protein N-terminal glutamine amidohydrolase [Capsicum annuum]|uniref:Protein N-terminal glutamine amidohydrolase n=1 Tax=Capsicum annuum TaxID=4072 RepID=A0A2G2ZFB1_CAPAN|nr:Protein N-terminal glutamine amidohydrolase [Capsicum annuum]